MGNRRLIRECLFVKTWEIHFNLSISQIFLFSLQVERGSLHFGTPWVGGTIEKFLPPLHSLDDWGSLTLVSDFNIN